MTHVVVSINIDASVLAVAVNGVETLRIEGITSLHLQSPPELRKGAVIQESIHRLSGFTLARLFGDLMQCLWDDKCIDETFDFMTYALAAALRGADWIDHTNAFAVLTQVFPDTKITPKDGASSIEFSDGSTCTIGTLT